jgi:predicted nucleic acid-binding protein
VRFWDSSAVVPLVVPQTSSVRMREEYAKDPALEVWCMTPVEVWSAVCRLRRDGLLDSPGLRTARNRLQALVESWIEIDDLRRVRQRAQRLLETHPLRSADALQLAAALVLVSDRPERVSFVTLDHRLGEAAEREGFEVVGVTAS